MVRQEVVDFSKSLYEVDSQGKKPAGEGAEVFSNWKHLPSGRCGSKTVSKDTAFLLLRKKRIVHKQDFVH